MKNDACHRLLLRLTCRIGVDLVDWGGGILAGVRLVVAYYCRDVRFIRQECIVKNRLRSQKCRIG